MKGEAYTGRSPRFDFHSPAINVSPFGPKKDCELAHNPHLPLKGHGAKECVEGLGEISLVPSRPPCTILTWASVICWL
jgi:hypothetical protein